MLDMSEEEILRYDLWIEDALRNVIRRSLETVRDAGLPGDHHFYITFQTDHEDVTISPWLAAEYPEEMTIVLQHQFDNLLVEQDGFEVTLRFGGKPEHLIVPFDAVSSFADPSVSFGLQLKSMEFDDEIDDTMIDELSPEDLGIEPGANSARLNDVDEEQKSGEVITLDAFRKK